MNTLGFNKKPSETTVVVAMSGGVDSSVVAGLLKQEGYNVIGITLQLYSSNTSAKKGSCCSGIDIYDARRVAQKLDIPHYVFNYEKTFKEDSTSYVCFDNKPIAIGKISKNYFYPKKVFSFGNDV